MRFTGQVRVPEVDHPGVPATFVVEDDQAEVLLDGESLGRWSLFDVHASRLVSAAFSVSLAGDEITFIADEPVDFAYKGVDHMAESWARYKAMTLPRRMIAVGRSRRGTRPSRVTELRDAMLANLEAQRAADWAQEVDDLEAAASQVATPLPPTLPPAPPPPPPPLKPVEASPVEPSPVEASPVESTPVEIPVSRLDDGVTPEARPFPARPGPGIVRRPPLDVPAIPVPEVDPIDVFQPEPPVGARHLSEPIETEEVADPEPEPIEVPASETIETPEPEATPEPEPDPEPAPEVPELIADLLVPGTEGDRDDTPKRLVVDLGAYEAPTAVDPVPVPTQPRIPALAVTTAPAPDKSGIFGAVRAAFVRSKGSHDHEFVEAPGGIGIIRHICSECGYISIGVSESDGE